MKPKWGLTMCQTMRPVEAPVDENGAEKPRAGRVPGKGGQSEVVVHQTVAQYFDASNVQSV